jgi:hypothetical protein
MEEAAANHWGRVQLWIQTARSIDNGCNADIKRNPEFAISTEEVLDSFRGFAHQEHPLNAAPDTKAPLHVVENVFLKLG